MSGYFLNILRINVHAIVYLPRTRWFVVFTWYISLFKKHKLFQLSIFFSFFFLRTREETKTVLKKYCYNNNDDMRWDSYVFIQPIEITNFCYLFFNILCTCSSFIVFCTSQKKNIYKFSYTLPIVFVGCMRKNHCFNVILINYNTNFYIVIFTYVVQIVKLFFKGGLTPANWTYHLKILCL